MRGRRTPREVNADGQKETETEKEEGLQGIKWAKYRAPVPNDGRERERERRKKERKNASKKERAKYQTFKK